jgi:hypothetical protein
MGFFMEFSGGLGRSERAIISFRVGVGLHALAAQPMARAGAQAQRRCMDTQSPPLRRGPRPGIAIRPLNDRRVIPLRLVRAVEEILLSAECWKLEGSPPGKAH